MAHIAKIIQGHIVCKADNNVLKKNVNIYVVRFMLGVCLLP